MPSDHKQWVASRYVLDAGSKTVHFAVGRYDRKRTLTLDPGLAYSTYLGGTHGGSGNGIAVDSNGNAYITGQALSADFPTTPGAYHTADGSVFVTKLSADGKSLAYSTYFGGKLTNGSYNDLGNQGYGIVVDSTGNAYVTGVASSTTFPTTPGAFQTTNLGAGNGQPNGFVTKLSADGKSLVYSTYLGGTGGPGTGIFGGKSFHGDYGMAVALDSNGEAYVTGSTYSIDFPTTPGTFQTTNKAGANGVNTFVTKLSADGKSLLYSTYLGGSGPSDNGRGISVDSTGNAYVAGDSRSSDFPITPGAFQTTNKGVAANQANVFVTKLSADGKSLVYSTYLGGTGTIYLSDTCKGFAVDTNGNAYIAGSTASTNFPITPGAYQTTNKAAALRGLNGFVTKLSADGKSLVYSTYLGGSAATGNVGDQCNALALDSDGNAYLAGSAISADFPTTPGSFHSAKITSSREGNGFVAKLSVDGKSLVYSTLLGGSTSNPGYVGDGCSAIATDGTGGAYVTGLTYYLNFPTTPGCYLAVNKAATYRSTMPFVTRLTLKPTPSRLDFNGDSHLDFLWVNARTTAVTGWQMNATTLLSGVTIAASVDSHWNVTAEADFNGDGHADLLWRNSATGDLSVWYMNGNTLIGSAYLARAVSLDWQLVSAADFDADGNADLLWRNIKSGDVVVWYMNGSTYRSFAYLAHGVSLQWQLLGSGYFTGSNNVDMLWSNIQTGDLAVWDMNNTQLVSAYYVAYQVAPVWQVAAIGDLDGNGVADIVWRNVQTGDVAAWLFSDPITYIGASIASAIPLEWQLAGPR